jgi:hypothetical protein
VGSYPTVSPLPSAITFHNPHARAAFRPSEGFPSDGHRGASHWRFIFCGTVRSLIPRLACANCTRSRPPGVTRRVALWPEAYPAEDFRHANLSHDFCPKRETRRPRCPDFPPGLPSCEGWPSDHPACPPRSVYHPAGITSSADGAEKYKRIVDGQTVEILLRFRDSLPPRLDFWVIWIATQTRIQRRCGVLSHRVSTAL